ETGIGFIITMSYDKFKELFMSSKALEQYYNTDSRSFRRRFDVERMETDSVYRDSVRYVIRDSLMKNSPEFRKRVEERQKQEQLERQENDADSSETDRPTDSTHRAIRKEEMEEQEEQEAEQEKKDSTNTQIDTTTNAIRDDEEERRSYED